MASDKPTIDGAAIMSAAKDISSSFERLAEMHGVLAAVLGFHMGFFMLILSRLEQERPYGDVRAIAQALKDSELQFIYEISSVLEGCDPDTVNKISKGVQDQARYATEEIAEKFGLDATLLLVPKLKIGDSSNGRTT